ncbi:MAG: tRNA lysidine(34) synthetase TilS, partial [Armatimonadetes bacterium]|nr:tRNA lysidine(34) synthetase TilS [Armatimonadota bacterium]
LIEVRRSDVEAYVEQHGLHPRTDATNLVAEYTRNRIRLDLLPLLRREYNPETDAAILRLAELARADAAYMNVEAEEAFNGSITQRGADSVSLDANAVQSHPLALRRRIVREAVKAVRGEIADVGFIHIEELLRLLDAGTDFKYELPGGVFVQRTRTGLAFSSSRPSELPIIYCYDLAVPGETVVPEIDVRIQTEVTSQAVDHARPRGSMEVVLDYEAISGKLVVRNWQPGDRIRPLGLGGSKKVQDLFVDCKIPREARHRIPLIADDEKVIWVAGLALSEQAKVTDRTRRYLIIGSAPA